MKYISRSIILMMFLLTTFQATAQLNFPDGSVQTTAAPEGNNIISIVGMGTNTENGTALRSAIASVTDATSTNQYTILLAAAVYDVGNTPLAMKSNVHIQGVNRQVSRITGSGSVTITGADSSSLLDLKVSSTTGFDILGQVVAHPCTLYSASGIFSEHFSVDFVIPQIIGVTGNLTGVSITSAAEVALYDCRVFAEELDNGYNTIGVFVSGNSSSVDLFGCIVGMTETNASGDITAIMIESNAEGWISKSDIDVEPLNGSSGTALKFTSGANVTITQSSVEAAESSVALVTSGSITVTAANSLFIGTVSTAYNNSGADYLAYSQCSNNFTDL